MSPKFPAVTSYQVAFIDSPSLSPRRAPRRTSVYACVDSSSPPRCAFEYNLVLDKIITVLKRIGFKFKRQSGSSHAIYYRVSDGRRTVVPIHAGKIVKRKTFKSILADSGLTIEAFIELNK